MPEEYRHVRVSKEAALQGLQLLVKSEEQLCVEVHS
jgi:hypothetical protein